MSISSPSRREDRRLPSGAGTYAGDVNLPGPAYAAFVRSVVPHGVLRAVDLAAARLAPGVLGVFTGTDLIAAGVGRGSRAPRRRVHCAGGRRERRTGSGCGRADLAGDRPLAAVSDAADAIALAAPQIWPDAPNTVALHRQGGDPVATDAAFARAAHVTQLRLVNNRVVSLIDMPFTAEEMWRALNGQQQASGRSGGVASRRGRPGYLRGSPN